LSLSAAVPPRSMPSASGRAPSPGVPQNHHCRKDRVNASPPAHPRRPTDSEGRPGNPGPRYALSNGFVTDPCSHFSVPTLCCHPVCRGQRRRLRTTLTP